MNLVKYYRGDANAEGVRVNRTIPVNIITSLGEGDETSSVCFYLGDNHQGNPPTPTTDSNVFIQHRPQATFFARVSSNKDPSFEDFQTFATDLEVDGHSVDLTKRYKAYYERPREGVEPKRRPELWFAKNQSSEISGAQ